MVNITKIIGNKRITYKACIVKEYCNNNRKAVRIITPANDRCLYTWARGMVTPKGYEGNKVRISNDVVIEAFRKLGLVSGATQTKRNNSNENEYVYASNTTHRDNSSDIAALQASINNMQKQMEVMMNGMASIIQTQANQAQFNATQANINMMQFNQQVLNQNINMAQEKLNQMSNNTFVQESVQFDTFMQESELYDTFEDESELCDTFVQEDTQMDTFDEELISCEDDEIEILEEEGEVIFNDDTVENYISAVEEEEEEIIIAEDCEDEPVITERKTRSSRL